MTNTPYQIITADCREAMADMADASVHAIVTDPPYHLTQASRGGSARQKGKGPFGRHTLGERGFMGQTWDGGDIAFQPEVWADALRVLRPGGHLLAFGGTRTYHRLACAIEDAGFEIRDTIAWVYGQGFPKSLDVSKAIDKAAGAAREWDGWGTKLKPAFEMICLARKPLTGTVVANVLAHGTGALNIGASRVGSETVKIETCDDGMKPFGGGAGHSYTSRSQQGRWPANLVHDGSEEVVSLFPIVNPSRQGKPRASAQSGDGWGMTATGAEYADSGSAARFFYCAKANKRDRDEGLNRKNNHPTVKPTDLMRWLVRLVTPPDGVVYDPFMGSGSTGKAAIIEGFRFIGSETEPDYADIARARLKHACEQANVTQTEMPQLRCKR